MLKRLIAVSFLCFMLHAHADVEDFITGPVFSDYGENVEIEGGLEKPESQRFKVVFDVSERDENGNLNNGFNSVARFINMHIRAGVKPENIAVAMVVHGEAAFDLMQNKAYKRELDKDNGSAELLDLLLDANVNVFLCGQSARFLDIAEQDLNPRVQISLSAMTANALLQQQGYTLNPF